MMDILYVHNNIVFWDENGQQAIIQILTWRTSFLVVFLVSNLFIASNLKINCVLIRALGGPDSPKEFLLHLYHVHQFIMYKWWELSIF